MHPSKSHQTLTRHPLAGAVIWMLCIQYFIIQVAAAMAWPKPYSLSQNPISDLGNTACGHFVDRFVCSPLHALMNLSFVLLGLAMVVGSALIYQAFRKTSFSLAGFSFMGIAGLGTLMVGAFPENTLSGLHVLGAFLAIFVGNVGIVLLGLTLGMPRSLRIFTLASGIIALAGLGLFGLHQFVGLGEGGTERLASYPQTIWLIVFGIYISSNRYSQISRKLRQSP